MNELEKMKNKLEKMKDRKKLKDRKNMKHKKEIKFYIKEIRSCAETLKEYIEEHSEGTKLEPFVKESICFYNLIEYHLKNIEKEIE